MATYQSWTYHQKWLSCFSFLVPKQFHLHESEHFWVSRTSGLVDTSCFLGCPRVIRFHSWHLTYQPRKHQDVLLTTHGRFALKSSNPKSHRTLHQPNLNHQYLNCGFTRHIQGHLLRRYDWTPKTYPKHRTSGGGPGCLGSDIQQSTTSDAPLGFCQTTHLVG